MPPRSIILNGLNVSLRFYTAGFCQDWPDVSAQLSLYLSFRKSD